MHYRKFIIANYRAIDSAEVPVSNNMIPVIGINESGKTSILQAILCFDRVKDSYNAGGHLDFKNKYVLGDHLASITAEVTFDSKRDVEAVVRRLKLSAEHELVDKLYGVLESRSAIQVTRSLNTRKYSVAGLGVDDVLGERVAKAIYKSLPVILYFDDFSDRVPEVIRFQKVEGGEGYKHHKSKTAEWQQIIEEVFKRATDGRHTLADFVAMRDSSDQKGLLSDIRDTLDEAIMKDWKELKSYGETLADDEADLKLSLEYKSSEEKGFRFEFKVQDRSRTKARFFKITERSKGFQWFFNFSMKLKFNPKYKDDQKGAIYLLDEPGSYLHSSAQEELLKALQSISETNTVIYCTHSQHLLDPRVINLAGIKIAAKERGTVRVLPFGSSGIPNYEGAMTPVYHALRVRTGPLNQRITVAVITEGITDFYFFSLLTKHRKDFKFKDVTFIPGAGATHLRELISFCLAWAERYAVFLDADTAGRKAARQYAHFFGSREQANFVHYATPGATGDVRLEDFLSSEDQKDLLDLTAADSVKAALPELYYERESLQREFIANLRPQTMSNLSIIQGRLRRLCED